MTIKINFDLLLCKNKIRAKTLSQKIKISEQNLSLLKNGKVNGIRFTTLDKLCEALKCQPGDLLEHVPNDK